MIEKFALATALTGIIILIIFSNIISPKIVGISSINPSMLGEKVSICGNITNIRSLENMEILTVSSLNDDSEMTAVLFESSEIGKGVACLTGEITEYNGKIEIEVEEIREG